MKDILDPFIEHARQKGLDHATIRLLLLAAGWREREISTALAAQCLDMAVPLPPDRGGAREAFLHLLTFTALYTIVISVGMLYFTCIDRLFPDPALRAFEEIDLSVIRWQLAAVIVSFPVFLGLSRFLVREFEREPEKATSAVRRWLTYLTLLLAAVALAADIVTLVYYFLEGGLSIRFLCKVLVVLSIGGLTFSYYYLSLRSSGGARPIMWDRVHRLFLAAAVLIVGAGIVWGFVEVGFPASQRLRTLDQRRIADLKIIEGEIRNIVYQGRSPWSERDEAPLKPLPKTLDDVAKQAQVYRVSLADPATRERYEYRVIDETHFELCATFTFALDRSRDVAWNHSSGRHCFFFNVRNPQGPTMPTDGGTTAQ